MEARSLGLEFPLEAFPDCAPRDPVVLFETREEGRFERRLEIPKDLVFLRGHFEGFAVVAGVVQLGWVTAALAAWQGSPAKLQAIEALKFPEPLLPGQQVSLEVEQAQADCFRFRVWDAERTFASGRLRARVSS